MRKLLVVGAVIGVILGILQLFYVRTSITKYGEKINSSATCTELTAACGFCPEGAPIANGFCYSKGKIQRYRGFPLNPKSGFNENKGTKIALLYANVAIFVAGVPLVFWVLSMLLRRMRKSRKTKKPSPSVADEPDPDVE